MDPMAIENPEVVHTEFVTDNHGNVVTRDELKKNGRPDRDGDGEWGKN